ncbi:MAG: hypothetical protein H0A76_02000 [Candidatus Thiodubiliella endoseptemdiera]|uniref:Uncharacterized protein n=1 Tax=Candidatus Thiodubiliella endoseptemdiera TaxID=2738886 RepID=A0A853EZE0_9GAMM|nr:hypothetical protein [Candidatus Thiodubiliella endoseptemdiera]
MVFKYSVQAGDSIASTDFDIDNPTSDITLNNITDVAVMHQYLPLIEWC